MKFSLAGTATYITDYTISPTPVWDGSKWYVTVLEGMTYRDILVTALYDGAAEPDETISITIDLKSCSSETITRNLTIKNRDAITANVTNSDPDYACYTGGVTLNAAGAGGWLNDGSYTYAWSPSAGLSATDIFNPTANPAISTIYSVTITDVCSNSVTTTQQIIPYHDAGYFGLWYGDISSDWDNCRNWGKGKIPDQTVNVIIPASGVTYWPTKTGNIIIGGTAGDNAKSITLQSTAAGAAQFTITGNLTIRSGSAYTLTCGSNATNKNQIFVSGNWSEGTLGGFVKGTSTVTFNGSATQQINNGLTRTYSFWNLIIDGTDAAFYYSGAQVSPGYRVNANDIIINSGKTMRTVRNN
ncbi:MAG: hypothetical protein A2491_01215 [Bacteroidetes bacterium RIFOXYC12_FULL_35_7]|nr:MAG: hypothetical protein A2491_01215 [Bacteroidetes bacterium RIFOXYC12_FULL_35_7]